MEQIGIRSGEHHGLSTCVHCARDFVTPVLWEPVGEEHWWIFLRCAECGTSREVTITNADAERFDDELAVAQSTIQDAARALELERMETELEAFAALLRYDLIDASDFAR